MHAELELGDRVGDAPGEPDGDYGGDDQGDEETDDRRPAAIFRRARRLDDAFSRALAQRSFGRRDRDFGAVERRDDLLVGDLLGVAIATFRDRLMLRLGAGGNDIHR